jgi:hypothetical protein
MRPSGKNVINGKEDTGGKQDASASETIAEEACCERTNKAAYQRATVGPADKLFRGQAKVRLIELPGSADDDPVVSKQQAAHCGDNGDAPNIFVRLRGYEETIRGSCAARSVHSYLTLSARLARRSAAPV